LKIQLTLFKEASFLYCFGRQMQGQFLQGKILSTFSLVLPWILKEANHLPIFQRLKLNLTLLKLAKYNK